jgi:tol-pal system protein YbgF
MMKKLATSFARFGVAGAIASAALFGVPAQAQDSRLSLADRVSRLEQQSQKDQGTVGVVNQVSDLQQQVQQLQGQIEEMQHQVQQLQDKNKAQYVDLDSRLGRLEGNGAAPGGNGPGVNAPGASVPSPNSNTPAPASTDAGGGRANSPAAAASSAPAGGGTADPAAAQAAYDAAFKALRGGDYATASRGFRGFLQQYPDSTLAPNAYYWLGESYYVTMNYPVAVEAFQRLLKQYPQSDKAPDGLLKLGYCQFELKQKDAAVATLKSVSTKYPGSKAAGLAQERLRRIQLQANN